MYLGMYKKMHEQNHKFLFFLALQKKFFLHFFFESGQNLLGIGSKIAQLSMGGDVRIKILSKHLINSLKSC